MSDRNNRRPRGGRGGGRGNGHANGRGGFKEKGKEKFQNKGNERRDEPKKELSFYFKDSKEKRNSRSYLEAPTQRRSRSLATATMIRMKPYFC